MFAWNFQTFSHSSVASVRQKIMAPFLTLLSLLKTSFFPKSRKILLANKKFPQCSVENKFKSICNKISQNMKCNVDLFTDKRLRYFFKYFFEVHNSKLKEAWGIIYSGGIIEMNNIYLCANINTPSTENLPIFTLLLELKVPDVDPYEDDAGAVHQLIIQYFKHFSLAPLWTLMRNRLVGIRQNGMVYTWLCFDFV